MDLLIFKNTVDISLMRNIFLLRKKEMFLKCVYVYVYMYMYYYFSNH